MTLYSICIIANLYDFWKFKFSKKTIINKQKRQKIDVELYKVILYKRGDNEGWCLYHIKHNTTHTDRQNRPPFFLSLSLAYTVACSHA